MGKIQYPPPIPIDDDNPPVCFYYGEPLEIQFDVSGYFSHDNDTAFLPNPPTGNFVAPPGVMIQGYFAVPEEVEVTFTFLDTANGTTYRNTIQIRPSCPPTKDTA